MNSNALFDPNGEKLSIYTNQITTQDVTAASSLNAPLVIADIIQADNVTADNFRTDADRLERSGIIVVNGFGLTGIDNAQYYVTKKQMADANDVSSLVDVVTVEGSFRSNYVYGAVCGVDILIPDMDVSSPLIARNITGEVVPDAAALAPRISIPLIGFAPTPGPSILVSQTQLRLIWAVDVQNNTLPNFAGQFYFKVTLSTI